MAVTLDRGGGCRNGLTERRNEERPQWSGGVRGRCRARTDDLFRVKEARYQLRQSPMWDLLSHAVTADSILADGTGRMHIGAWRGRSGNVAAAVPFRLDTPGFPSRNLRMTGGNAPRGRLSL